MCGSSIRTLWPPDVPEAGRSVLFSPDRPPGCHARQWAFCCKRGNPLHALVARREAARPAHLTRSSREPGRGTQCILCEDLLKTGKPNAVHESPARRLHWHCRRAIIARDVATVISRWSESRRFPQDADIAKKMMVPRGGARKFHKVNDLAKSGTVILPTASLCLSDSVSHQRRADSAPLPSRDYLRSGPANRDDRPLLA
jgi:hypothetical protein